MVTRAATVYEEINIEGDWWLADRPSNKCRGTLKGSSATDFRLHLEGTFVEDPSAGLSDGIILGQENVSGRLITLLQCLGGDCRYHGSRLGLLAHAMYFAHWVLVGKHYTDYASIRFDRATFGLRHLEAWYDIHRSYRSTDAWATHKSISVEFTAPPEVTLARRKYMQIGLVPVVSGLGWEVGQVEAKIEHGIRIFARPTRDSLRLFSPDAKVGPRYTLWDVVNRMCALLSMCVAQETHAFEIVGYVKDGSSPVEIHRIQVIPDPEKSKMHHQMLLPWPLIAERPKSKVQHWLAFYDQYPALIHLFLAAAKSRHSSFPSIVQALEGLHLAKYPQTTAQEKAARRELKKAVKGLIESHASWSTLNIRCNIGLTLRERLRALSEEFEEEVIAVTGSYEKLDTLLKQVVATRNTEAHGSTDTEKILTGQERHNATLLLRAIMELHLLQIMKLRPNMIRSATQRHIEALKELFEGFRT